MNLSGVIQNEEDAIREIERRSALKTNSYEVIIGIQKELKEFDATIDQLQILANSEPPGLRDEARMRISNLKSSCSYVKSIVEMTLRKRFKQTISDQQEELFSMAGRQTDIEAEVETGKSLDMSLNNISNAIHTGRDTMQELSSQKERLKSIQRKALDIMSSIKRSAHVLTSSLTQAQGDWILIAVGSIIVLTIMFYLFF